MAQTSTEGKLSELVDAARGLFRFVQEAAAQGSPVHEVEKGIGERTLQMGRQALGQFLACQGDGDVGEQVRTSDGRSWERLEESHGRWYQSIFGPFRLERAVYGTREGQRIEYVPLDTRLGLPESEFSYVLADGKGVPMRRPADQMPAGCRRKKGEKANKKQMATVGCVYTVDPKERTAEEVVAALFRERRPQDAWAEPEPVAQQKRVWSSLSYPKDGQRIDGEEVVFRWMFEEVTARREPRLWEAAYLFHPEGSARAATFVRSRLLEILRGRTGYVIGGLRQRGTKQGLRGTRLRKLRTICNYFQKNLTRMRYDAYLAEGYPIASGVIEGACRYVVKDRMERAGMRWTVAGAQAMLDLRTTFVNGQWDEFQSYRIERESQRLYPHWILQNQSSYHVAA
jgi:hypothetical protein